MFWSMLAVVLGFCGLAVLGVLAVRVYLEVRRLGSQVAETSLRITRAADDLERAANSMARTGGETPLGAKDTL
ncbi:hypothetical protein [Streptomyces tsukubensis]|uniref:Uncharacterized protein n=1 Tax=Streptomyces tsukubensis TaxID=83656 RepID=A0A1V4AF44_9ACTN|nr:hypothetical protein [Streptomyces tsukubensis]OON82256.1 hypothetical protein B1H18_04270 [Streptomyces tsukubensis]QFR92747.1 hypothetical protein GBW32_06290 [Streptomyces tsukubensis]